MAEGNGLLNRRRGKTSTEGSNPSLSATAYLVHLVYSVCLVCLVERNEPDRPEKPDEPDRPGSLIFLGRSCNSASLFLP